MKFHMGVVAVAVALTWQSISPAVVLFEEDFEVDSTANWTVNSGPTDFDDPDGDIDGDFSSNQAKFFFDYSTVGIPAAPNSVGGNTRGMKLMANQDGDFDGITVGDANGLTGISVSPIGQDFSAAGDYKLTFDWWGNFPGPFPAGSSGTTQLSTFGIGTSGAVANYAGVSDSIFFAATADGGSGADFRAYSAERQFSYQIPFLTVAPAPPAVRDDFDSEGNPIDSHATYHAFSRNNSAGPPGNFNNLGSSASVVDAADFTAWRDNLGLTSEPDLPVAKASGNANVDLVVDQVDFELWKASFGDTLGLYAKSFPGVTATTEQLALFPQQEGTTANGAAGMTWREVEIAKIGDLVTWTVDGALLISIDTAHFDATLGGGNILFGHGDINSGASSDVLRFDLLFTLIDNIKVETIDALGSGALSVPEPGALVMSAFALVCGTLFNRRSRRCQAGRFCKV